MFPSLKENKIKTTLKELLFKNINITENQWELINAKVKIVKYKKGDTILFSNDVCDKIRFLNTGITRMFYFDENAKEFTCHLSFNDNNKYLIDYFSIDYSSFSNETASRYSIDVLEDSKISEISLNDVKELSLQMDIFTQIHTIVNNQVHLVMSDNLIDINIRSNAQRYQCFIEKYPNIHKKIPQYIIASYLGITPVALSRLKAKL